MDAKQVMEHLGASSSLQEEDCAPAPGDSISAEEVYAELNARSPVVINDRLPRMVGAIEQITRWAGQPVKSPIPIRILREATAAEYRAAVRTLPSTLFPYYYEIESVD